MRTVVGLLLAAAAAQAEAARSFNVTNNQFVKDGAPYVIRSGSLHYHRLHPSYWRDRLLRMQAMGLNHVQTYVPWNFHELQRDYYDFSGPRDVGAFLDLVNELGMTAFVRPGPYICGEHDFGGFPSYLVTIPGLVLRTNDTAYLDRVDAWWATLMPVLTPRLYANGGAVAALQIENEFGSYGDTGGNPADYDYMLQLKAMAQKYTGNAPVIFYTTDGGSSGYLSHGAMPGILYATGDFGPTTSPGDNFNAQDQYNPPGWRAHIDSEYYPGWLTHWGEGMANTSSIGSAAGVSTILALGASVNLYMAYGGTNYGYNNGANAGGDGSGFAPVITSYDYDAPISEGGEHGFGGDGDKYLAHQQVFAYWAGGNLPAEPPLPPRAAYASIALSDAANLLDVLFSVTPVPVLGAASIGRMEGYSIGTITGAGGVSVPANLTQGFILYRTNVTAAMASAAQAAGSTATIAITNPGDRVIVLINGAAVGTIYRSTAPTSITFDASLLTPGATLSFLVENMGHINYGHGLQTEIANGKGITSAGAIALNGAAINAAAWDVFPLVLDGIFNATMTSPAWRRIDADAVAAAGGLAGPVFVHGVLTIPAGGVADTYLTVCGFNKGVMAVNGVNVGRYWETQGPQHAYYIPAALLQEGDNHIVLFELAGTPANVTVGFTDHADFTGAVCKGASASAAAAAIAAPAPRALGTVQRKQSSVRGGNNKVVQAAAACAASPSVGINITLQPCSGTPAVNVGFAFNYTVPAANAGRIQLAANPSLCVVVNGTNPSTGTPNLALGACDASDPSQDFIWFQGVGGGIMSVTRGTFIDLPNSSTATGTRLELYAWNGGYANQRFEADATTGTISSVAAPSMCVAAC